MILRIFNVEHGACALLDCDNGTQIMIDAGHNATTGWKPGTYLNSIGRTQLQQLIITNYDEDHVSGLPDLLSKVHVQWLMRNTSVDPSIIRYLKSEDGMGSGIDVLVKATETTFKRGTANALAIPPSGPDYGPGIELQIFNNTYPTFDDENNLSVIVHLMLNGTGVMFCGDMEKDGWEALIPAQPALRAALARTNIFIAPHHGRRSGYCDDIFTYCKPQLVVVSDKEHMHETQKTSGYYAYRASGAIFRNSERKFVSTRSDGDLVFHFPGRGWSGF